MKQTEYARRLDSNGRLVIPSALRDELNIQSGDTFDFFIHEQNGKTYLCIECYRVEDEIEKAKRVLREAGFIVKE